MHNLTLFYGFCEEIQGSNIKPHLDKSYETTHN